MALEDITMAAKEDKVREMLDQLFWDPESCDKMRDLKGALEGVGEREFLDMVREAFPNRDISRGYILMFRQDIEKENMKSLLLKKWATLYQSE